MSDDWINPRIYRFFGVTPGPWEYPKAAEADMILTPCDCRAPAPSKSRPSPLSRHYQCLGCNGWVSVRRIAEENIKMRG